MSVKILGKIRLRLERKSRLMRVCLYASQLPNIVCHLSRKYSPIGDMTSLFGQSFWEFSLKDNISQNNVCNGTKDIEVYFSKHPAIDV